MIFRQIWVPGWENRGSAATAVAPASHGAGAHANHDPVASGGAERRACAVRSGCGGSTGGNSWKHFELAPWASRRRRDLLELMDRLEPPTIAELSQAIEQEGGGSVRRRGD